MQLKLKSFFNAMAFCMSLAWKTSKHYTIGRCTLLILSTCTPYISMFLNKILIDSLTIINEKNYFSILFILILVMLMAIITKLFSKLSAYYQNIHSDLLEHEIEKMVMKKTMKTNIEFYDSPEYLNTLQAVMTDFFSLNEITWNIFYGMSGICSLIIAAGMIGRYQWSYAIVLLIFSIPSAVLNQKFSKKAYKLRLNNMPYERQQSYMYSVASDRYFAFDIRLHNLCDFFMNRYKKFWSICFKDRKQLKKKQLICIFPTYVIPEIIIFLFMSRIVKSILNGDSSVGDFSLYIGLFTSLIAATYTVIETFSSVYEDKLKIDTIEKFSKYEEEENRCGELEVNDNIKIEFKNVSFKYPMSEKYVLQNFSLEIKQGDRICILGVNGSGKSTVIKLLLRFYDVDEGEILINSKNIKEYDVCNLRSVFSIVFQDYINYSFTLRDNIKITDLENAEWTDEDAIKALHIVDADNILKKLPEGLDTYIQKIFDRNGYEPSGGEQQKIALARAVNRRCKVMILDEPTAAIDPESECNLLNNLKHELYGKTLIFTSHRLSAVHLADKIVLLENGQVKEEGSHKELLELNKEYARLYRLQMNTYNFS